MVTNGDFNPIEILVAIKTFLTVFIGALSIGCLVGVCTAIVTKFTYLRDYPLLETSLFFLMSYCSFLVAEVASLSGMFYFSMLYHSLTHVNLNKQLTEFDLTI